MYKSFFKIMKSRLLLLLVLFIFVPGFICGGPAEIPYRLDKATVGLVGDVKAEVCVKNNGISIEMPPSGSGGGGLLGVFIEAGIDSANNAEVNVTVAPLREMVKDINFRDALHAALQPIMKEISWLRVTDLRLGDWMNYVSKKDILKKTDECSFLDIQCFYQLSPTAEILKISTEFGLYLKGSAKAAVKGNVLFTSDRIGKFDINDEAIALWAGYDGATFRKVLKMGIDETVRMLKFALLHAGGISAIGTDSKSQVMRIRTKHGEEDYGPKELGEITSGWIIEENESRIIFQLDIGDQGQKRMENKSNSQPGGFVSIPKSDIIVPN